MQRSNLPLNALRAFEASARHLNMSRAAIELCVSQTALSHQIRNLEERLGVTLFRRLPRGLSLTDEGTALQRSVGPAFDDMSAALDRFADGRFYEQLDIGVVTTFAVGLLFPHLAGFEERHPEVGLRIFTNNNRVDIAGEGLAFAIRFGDGQWPGLDAVPILDAPLTPLCAPDIAARLTSPERLGAHPLIRSYRRGEWEAWFTAVGLPCPALRGPVIDSSVGIAELAVQGHGIALLPHRLFGAWIGSGRLVRPFAAEVAGGRYWLTRLRSRPLSPAMRAFQDWVCTLGTETTATG